MFDSQAHGGRPQGPRETSSSALKFCLGVVWESSTSWFISGWRGDSACPQKRKLRKVEWLSHGHTAGQRQSREPRSSVTQASVSPTLTCFWISRLWPQTLNRWSLMVARRARGSPSLQVSEPLSSGPGCSSHWEAGGPRAPR